MSANKRLRRGFVTTALLMSPLPLAAASVEIDALLETLERTRIEFDIPAVGFTLVDAEQVLWTGGLGVVARDTRAPVTADTVFRIGSITKAFTSLALLLAQEDGALQLDAPVRRLAPEASYENLWAQSHPIRLVHLLEHTGGFTDLSALEFRHSDPKPLTLEESFLVAPDSRLTRWPPGLHSSYSNSGAGLAAYVLERKVGVRYEDFVERRLFKPLGMESAGFFLDSRTRKRLATGYDTDGVSVLPYWHMIYRAFGGINVSVRDMAPFLQLLLNRGRHDGRQLVPAESIERMEDPQTTLSARSGLKFGYGLGSYHWIRNGLVFHGHGGDGDGYLTRFGYNRDTGLGYFVVINVFQHTPLRALREQIEKYLVAERKPPAPPPVAAIALARYTGDYVQETYRFGWRSRESKPRTLEIVLDDGALYTQKPGEPRRALIPVNAQHFRRADHPVATIAVVNDTAGNTYIQGDLGNYRKVKAIPDL